MTRQRRKKADLLLVVGEKASLGEVLAARLGEDCELSFSPDADSAIFRAYTESFACILLGPSAQEPWVLRRLREAAPHTPILLVPPSPDPRGLARAVRLGLSDAVPEGEAPRAAEPPEVGPEHIGPGGFDAIVSRSPSMREVLELGRKMARNNSRILITGETGTGKDLLARAIHSEGPRGSHPFVPVNCAAIPGNLAESELFGHEKGAFTGADRTQRGKFEQAHRGTILLDEVTCLSQELQLKLLRVLQDGIVYRVGGESPIRVDARIIAATNRDIATEVAQGRFREDFYYRLKVVTLHLPPLRERREDIPDLLRHFLSVFNGYFRRDLRGYTEAALTLLCRYEWPGNVRELEHAVEYLVIMEHGNRITTEHLSTDILAGRLRPSPGPAESGVPLRDAREGLERQMVLDALSRTRWNQTRAAELLGLSRNRLIAKMKKYAIKTPPSGP